MADMWLITRTRTKKEQLFGFQFGKALPRQTQEHFPSTCYFSIIKYQMSSTAAQWPGWTHDDDGAIITHLIWHLHWHLPPLQPPPGRVPHSRDTRDTTTHRWVGSVQSGTSNHNPSLAEQFRWFDALPKPSLCCLQVSSFHQPATSSTSNRAQATQEIPGSDRVELKPVAKQSCSAWFLFKVLFLLHPQGPWHPERCFLHPVRRWSKP